MHIVIPNEVKGLIEIALKVKFDPRYQLRAVMFDQQGWHVCDGRICLSVPHSYDFLDEGLIPPLLFDPDDLKKAFGLQKRGDEVILSRGDKGFVLGVPGVYFEISLLHGEFPDPGKMVPPPPLEGYHLNIKVLELLLKAAKKSGATQVCFKPAAQGMNKNAVCVTVGFVTGAIMPIGE